jgi:hypothetical protein
MWASRLRWSSRIRSEDARCGRCHIRSKKEAFARILAQELSAYDAPGAGGPAKQQGRASVDLLFLFAIEFGWIGQ